MQDILNGSDILCREVSINTPSIIATSSPTDIQCNMDNRKNFVAVVSNEFESLDTRSIVLNFGVDANSDENGCIA